MVSVSHGLPDLDINGDIESPDHRFRSGFRSLSLDSVGYSDIEHPDDAPPFAGTPDPSSSRRRRRYRQHSDGAFEAADPFVYKTVADGNVFRLLILHSGTGSEPISCNLIWESSVEPTQKYCCLSYAWGDCNRDAAILCDGYRLMITANLFRALQDLRKPKSTLLIWADQICISQDNKEEKAHQVSIMKHIFRQAHKTYVWLGEADDRTEKLCLYAKRMRRGEDTPKSLLSRLFSQRGLKEAIHSLLQRPWFQRVWVIPEVALSRHTTVACGRSHITWDTLVRLIRDVPVPTQQAWSFDKQLSLLGNPRQRTAIITQMVSSQRACLAHTDITQLLILAKSSHATDVRDMVYAFYGLTHLTTYPDYSLPADHATLPVERLYVEIIQMYINNIQMVDSYSTWHSLTDSHKSFQLASILYSAGALHQHREHSPFVPNLPSWIPDLTYAWHLSPVWSRTTPNFITGAGRDEWSTGIRTAFRAGGDTLRTFDILDHHLHHHLSSPALCVSALLIDTLLVVNHLTPASTPSASMIADDSSDEEGIVEAGAGSQGDYSPSLRYGRHSFATTAATNLSGIATPGIQVGDVLAVLAGADVPFVLRPVPRGDPEGGGAGGGGGGGGRRKKTFQLLCEAYVQDNDVMRGRYFAEKVAMVGDIVLI